MDPVENLQKAIEDQVAAGVSPLSIVVVEQHPDYPGELVFQLFEGETLFYSKYQTWISPFFVLNELFNLEPFLAVLEQDGWTVILGPSSAAVLDDHQRWGTPLAVEGFELHAFQQYSLQRAFETDYWFFNWATGAGKSFACTAGAKWMFDHDLIDVVLCATVSKSKINQARFFQRAGLDVVVNDGSKPKRERIYQERHQVYVMNYEKLNFDAKDLTELVTGQRVLWIFDEVQKIVTDDKQNKARQSFEKLTKLTAPESKVWTMSASVVNGNPLRFRDVFGIGSGRHNPLEGQARFVADYADKVTDIEIKQPSGRSFFLLKYDWNQTKLTNIRHRVGSYTQTARKTDPGIAPYFKGLATIVEPIQMPAEDRKISEAIIDAAWEVYQAGGNLMPYYSILRYLCNTPESLRHTEFEPGRQIAKEFGPVLDKIGSAKVDRLNEQLESIRESGDQVLVFTHFTTVTLHLIKDKIEVPHVVHYGTGQSNKDSQAAQDEFKSNPDVTCFLSSDAGMLGISMQNARYVIQYEPTYSYDDGMQRASRIDRADSHLDGLTNYVYLTEDSVEERVWAVNQERRHMSALVQGTQEVLSHGSERSRRSEADNLAWLIFGSRA